MMTFTEFVTKARTTFSVDRKDTIHTNPISFLYDQKWNVPVGPPFSEDELARMNMTLDEAGCFGRAVKAAVLSEIYFPDKKMYAGEVLDDLCRTMLVEMATDEKWNDETFIADMLQSECPHIIIVDENGRQFDPIFTQLSWHPETLAHPEVGKHDLWEGLYAAYIVSVALTFRFTDPAKSLDLLHQADDLCSDFITIKENLAAVYGMTAQFNKGIEYLRFAVGKRKDAKKLFVLWILSGDETYKKKLTEEYDIRMLQYLLKTYMP
ncbi:MAG TPA: hypothetical protein PK950_01000 [Candidatus Paceibacterota bacterium]|nr:hypothetical protein [Candidatus Paceibacterota bacterium]